ncbi:MAG: Grx4 family monothiol glutaredoxin [Myxococcota bacterium]|nr:Grx4 family monothiol glutaredoxin [Myxococcota bacterium]MDW8361104.1 Grx4 family monothiol glutaredoxin [Myxococcales bacterium]
MDDAFRTRMQAIIDAHPIVLFMKGTKNFPRCGFSATVVEVLRRLGVDFEAVDVLADPQVREGMKEFSNWPTYPQLYVGGKFVGGCDIVRDMYTSGELEPLVREAVARAAERAG